MRGLLCVSLLLACPPTGGPAQRPVAVDSAGEPPAPAPAPAFTRDDPPTLAVDMTRFDLACTADADCTTVRAAPCGACGCNSAPLAVRDLEAFRAQIAAISCPPPPSTPSVHCGGCPGYRGRCVEGTCTARAE